MSARVDLRYGLHETVDATSIRPPAAVRGVQRRDVDCPMAAGTTAAATIKWNSLGFVAFAFDPFWLDDAS